MNYGFALGARVMRPSLLLALGLTLIGGIALAAFAVSIEMTGAAPAAPLGPDLASVYEVMGAVGALSIALRLSRHLSRRLISPRQPADRTRA